MEIGIYLRNFGPPSTRELLGFAAARAEEAGLDDLWLADHIAIPPDDAEGSGGRYLDPLATLAWLAGRTERIGLGTGVLVLPYRPPLATAKWVATIQELSGGRLKLGVGAGWMEAEFRAVGVPLERRGAVTDETLRFLHECFAADEVHAGDQPFLFLPRPPRPKIYVGGTGAPARRRAARLGDGWMPMGTDPKKLAAKAVELRLLAQQEGREVPEILLITTLPLDEPDRARQVAATLREAGATQIIHASRYANEDEVARITGGLGALRASL